MRKLIIPLLLASTVFLFARLLCGYFVYAVPWFAVLLKAFTGFTVGFGVTGVALMVLQIIKEFRHNRRDKDNHDD